MKLYWRFKKNGKWSWKAATVTRHAPDAYTIVAAFTEEEE